MQAEGAQRAALEADLKYLVKLWEVIQERCSNADVKTLIHEDLSLPLRVLRDMVTTDVDHILVDSASDFEEMKTFAGTFLPEIEDMLELSRIGRVDEPDTLVDPLGVIQQVIADQKTQFEGCEVQIDSPVQRPMLLCNRTRVYQIFSNLIGNAMAHMGPVDAPRVEVSIEDEAGLHHIRVADNGKGVAPENHEKIFEVFSTLGRRADGRKPTGVGLAIVRKIAVQHGGSAWVESPTGGGCIFHVTLRAS